MKKINDLYSKLDWNLIFDKYFHQNGVPVPECKGVAYKPLRVIIDEELKKLQSEEKKK